MKHILRILLAFWFPYVLAKPVWETIDASYGFFVATLSITIPLAVLGISIVKNDIKKEQTKVL